MAHVIVYGYKEINHAKQQNVGNAHDLVKKRLGFSQLVGALFHEAMGIQPYILIFKNKHISSVTIYIFDCFTHQKKLVK